MKHIYIIIAVAVTLVTYSCKKDFLSPAPTSAISAASYYETDEQLFTAVISMYDGIQGVNSLANTDGSLNHSVQVEYYLTEMRSDNTATKSSEGEAAQFESFSVEATNGIVNNYYRSMYNIIYRANNVLENIGVATAANAPIYEGEAKFVRAYAYFNLVRLYGDVPLITKVIGPLEKEVQFARVNTAMIYDLIESDLKFAASNLGNGSVNRGSQAAAEALLAKVHLTNGNYGDALTLCQSVLGSGFSLESNFNDVFYNEGNSEVLFAVGYDSDNSSDSQNFSAEWQNAVGRTSGVNYATAEAVAALAALGGTRDSLSQQEDPAQAGKYQVLKYVPDSGDPTLAGNDWIVIRLADVMLMHVEAVMAGGASTSDAGAIASFQAVRDRAGLTTPVTSITKQELLDERRVELAFENHRLFDLVRFGEANTVLSNFATANGYSFSATDLLLPIPSTEIGLSSGALTQNPGY